MEALNEPMATRTMYNGILLATDGRVSTEAEISLEYGKADEAIVDAHDIDLVAMGTHGRPWVERQRLGSVTEQMITTGPFSVLAVRQG